MEWKIPLYKVYTDKEDLERVTRVIERGSYWAVGPEIEEFERTVAQYLGVKEAIAFNSGTSALHATMVASGLKGGDKVTTASFSFIASANAAYFVGAESKFADIEDATYGLDARSLEKSIEGDEKMVMPVHIGGLLCRDIIELKEIAERKNITLVEDACESIGSVANGRKAGTFGDAAVLSFCGNKVITTGEGGMVVTNSGELSEKLKLVRSHGRLEKEPYFLTNKSLDYIELGFNWRMPTMVAALGIAQMNKLDKVVEMRRKIAARLTSEFQNIDEVIPPEEPKGFRHIYQMYTIRVKSGKRRRDALRDFMSKKGIITKVYFDPIHLTYFYRQMGHKEGELPVTEKVSGEVITLPIYPTMTDEEIEYLSSSVKQFFSQ